jgi:glycosyl transferase family 2
MRRKISEKNFRVPKTTPQIIELALRRLSYCCIPPLRKTSPERVSHTGTICDYPALMVRLAFVIPDDPDPVGTEIAESLKHACDRSGLAADLTLGAAPKGDVPVLMTPAAEIDWTEHGISADQVDGALILCTALPGTTAYESVLRVYHRAAAVLTPDLPTLRALRGMGVDAHHLPPYKPMGIREVPPRGPDHRDIDVAVVEQFSHRRAQILARSAEYLSRWRCDLHLLDDLDAPVDVVTTFSRARATLLIRASDSPGFQWFRAIQAMHVGCAVLSERSSDTLSLRAGIHFSSAGADSMGLLLQPLLENERWRCEMVTEAARTVAPLTEAIAVKVLADLAQSAKPSRLNRRPRVWSSAVDLGDVTKVSRPKDAVSDPTEGKRRQAEKRRALAALKARRASGLTRSASARADAVHESASYRDYEPDISVLVTLFNDTVHVKEALASVAVADPARIEVIVVDDGSVDDSAHSVTTWMERCSDVPAVLLAHPANRGLPHARNTGVQRARGEFVFILDSDNAIFPRALTLLVGLLRATRRAAFAYGMLEMYSPTAPIGVRSYHDWQERRLRNSNPVDAMALIRSAVLRDVGGYATDERLHGWEDYDLWCSIAERGGTGVFLAEFVGRYRVAEGSMLSLTDRSFVDAYAALIERHPNLMAGVEAPTLN